LVVKVEDKEVLKNVSFKIDTSEVCILMGPNGAGKSSLSNVLLGNPKYEVVSGDIVFNGKRINDLGTDERAKLGMFMSFQHPVEIDGVTMTNFLRTAYNSLKGKNLKINEFMKILNEKLKELEMDSKFRTRFVNKGFSGGEKKRSEMLQLLLFEPKFAILDEVDSGLDVDSIKLVAKAVNKVITENKTGVLLITHNNKFLDFVKADKVIVLKNGEIEKEGSIEILKEISEKGFN
jgi:Fe-S cluster assembly ATP-binding protein